MASLEERKAQLRALREARELRQQQLAAEVAPAAAATPAPDQSASSSASASPQRGGGDSTASSQQRVKVTKILALDVLPSSRDVSSPPDHVKALATRGRTYEASTQTDAGARQKITLSDDDACENDDAARAEEDPNSVGRLRRAESLPAPHNQERLASITSFTGAAASTLQQQQQHLLQLVPQRSLLERAMELEAGGGGGASSAAAAFGYLRRNSNADDDALSSSSYSSSGGLSSAAGGGESLLDKIMSTPSQQQHHHHHLRVVELFTPPVSSSVSSSMTIGGSNPSITQVCFSPQQTGPLLLAAATTAGEIFVAHPSSGGATAVAAKLLLHADSAARRNQCISSMLFLNVNPDLLAAGTTGGRLLLFDLRDRRGGPVCSSFPSIDGHSGEPMLGIIEPSISHAESSSGALRYVKNGAEAAALGSSSSPSSSAAIASLSRLVSVGSSTVCTWSIGDVVSQVAESSPLLGSAAAFSSSLLLGTVGGSSIIVPTSSVALVDSSERPLHISCCAGVLRQSVASSSARLRVGARDGSMYAKPLEHFLELRGRRAKMDRLQYNHQSGSGADSVSAGAGKRHVKEASSSSAAATTADTDESVGAGGLSVCALSSDTSGNATIAATLDGALLFSSSSRHVQQRFDGALSAPAVGVKFCASFEATSSAADEAVKKRAAAGVTSFISADFTGKISLWDVEEDEEEADEQHDAERVKSQQYHHRSSAVTAQLSLRHTIQLQKAAQQQPGTVPAMWLHPTCLDVDVHHGRLAAVGTREGSVQFVAIPVAAQ